MPVYTVQGPDGRTYDIEGPEGAQEADIIGALQAHLGGSAAAPEPPDATEEGALNVQAALERARASQPVVSPPRMQVNRLGSEARRTYNAADEMTPGQQFFAGVGKSVVDTGHGLAQLGVQAIDKSPPNLAMEAITGQSPWDATIAQQQTDAAERQRLDAPLMDTGAGVAGNIVGTLSQVVAPGAVAKVAEGAVSSPKLAALAHDAGAALLPTGARSNVVQGVALGGAQPVADESDRLKNMALGGGGAAVGAMVPAVARGARALIDPLTDAGSDRIIANTLSRFASDADKVRNPVASRIPGVEHTLAEATLDPGMARLQRTLQSSMPDNSNALDRAYRDNNAARVQAIQGIAGDDAAMSAAEAARKQASQGPLNAALQKSGVNLERTVKRIDGILAGGAGERDTVKNALASVRAKLVDGVDDQGAEVLKHDVERIYGVRKHIDDLLAGKAAGDNAAASAARRELMLVKKELDRAVFNAAPEFKQYLAEYVKASQPINQMEVGRELLKRSQAGGSDPTNGLPILAPAQFQRNARNLDDIAAKATGFKRAKADQILAPGQRQVIDDIADSLARNQFAQSAGKAAGSDTFQNLASQNVLTELGGPDVLAKLGPIGRVSSVLDTAYKVFGVPDRLKARMTEVIVNPKMAASVLAKLPKRDQQAAQRMYASLTGRTLALGQE